MDQKQDGKIVLYWLEQSRSQRILWLLEELKLEYELKTYKRINQLAPPELKDIHPLGKSPIVTIESKNASKPLVLAESGVIIEYLVSHYGPWLEPKRYSEGQEGQVGGESEEWMRYRYYMHYTEGSLMPFLVMVRILDVLKKSVPFFIKPVARLIAGAIESNYVMPNLKTSFEFLESQIASSPNHGEYLCGAKLTGADIILSFPLGRARGKVGFNKDTYPKLWAYVDRLEAHEGFKRAVDKIVEIEGSSSSNL